MKRKVSTMSDEILEFMVIVQCLAGPPHFMAARGVESKDVLERYLGDKDMVLSIGPTSVLIRREHIASIVVMQKTDFDAMQRQARTAHQPPAPGGAILVG